MIRHRRRSAQPAFLGTHVYVNTVVAVLLGWVVLDEQVTIGRVAAAADQVEATAGEMAAISPKDSRAPSCASMR